MNGLADELRLGVALGVSALMIVAAYRFIRRATGADRIAAGADALLLFYLVQYVVVCLLGLLGILSAWTLLATVAAVAGVMIARSTIGRVPDNAPDPLSALARGNHYSNVLKNTRVVSLSWRQAKLHRYIAAGCLLFVCGYVLGMIWLYRASYLPGDDALSYHLPIAAEWIRSHDIHFYTPWFFNPANAYSPLAGETFVVWLLAPMGNDMLVRFVQMPALVFIWLALVTLMRGMGVRIGAAGLIATAAVLCRAFASQAILVKDDLFITAFFAMALASCRPQALKDRLGPWRAGAALGLFAATKYTMLLSAPLLLLCIDAPIRAGWTRWKWLIALATAITLSVPWYVRTWIWTGNPLYPAAISLGPIRIFAGLFQVEPMAELRTLHGAWHAITGMYHSVPPIVAEVLIVAWVLALVRNARRLRSEPLLRACLLGAPLGVLIFVFACFVPEIRYMFPALLLFFAAAGLTLNSRIWAAGLAVISILVGAPLMQNLIFFIQVGAGIALLGILLHLMPWRGLRWTIGSIAAIILACGVYVYYGSTVQATRQSLAEQWAYFYPEHAPLWRGVDQTVPPDAMIAYANLYYVRPLMGWDYQRRILYVPTNPKLKSYHDLPSSDVRILDPDIRPYMSKLLASQPDHESWLGRLLGSGAGYLVVSKQTYQPQPPELLFAGQDRAHFRLIFDDPAGAIFQILR